MSTLLIALFFLFILSLPVVAVNLANTLQDHQAFDFSTQKNNGAQAIIVIGGGSRRFAPEYENGATVNGRTLLRLRYVAKLVKKIEVPILVSGGVVFKNSNANSEADLMAAVLRDEFNTPVKWLEKRSRNTAENALYSYQMLAKENIKQVILVTHAMHMSRAVEQFKNVGFSVFAAPTVFVVTGELSVFSFLPSARALETSSLTMHEWMGKIWYMVRY